MGLENRRRPEEIVEDGLYIKSLLEKVPSEKLEDLEQLKIMETIQKTTIYSVAEFFGVIFFVNAHVLIIFSFILYNYS